MLPIICTYVVPPCLNGFLRCPGILLSRDGSGLPAGRHVFDVWLLLVIFYYE